MQLASHATAKEEEMSVGFKKYLIRKDYHWDVYYKEKANWYVELVDITVNELPPKGTVLDVGCGDGLICSLLSQKGLTVEGFDAEEVAIEYAKKHNPELELWVDKIEEVDLKDKKYDYMIAIDVIEHFKYPNFLVQLFDLSCKKYMLLSTDNPKRPLRRYDYHRISFDNLKQRFRNTKIDLLYETEESYLVKIAK